MDAYSFAVPGGLFAWGIWYVEKIENKILISEIVAVIMAVLH